MRYNLQTACYPFTHWPVLHQLAAYGLALLLCTFVGVAFWAHQQSATHVLRIQLDKARHTLSAFRQQLNSSQQDMTNVDEAAAPSASSLSAQASEMTKRADEQGIRVNGLTISLPNNGQASLQPAMLTTQVQGTYPILKVWLGQNLQAYPWMAIDQMQWRLSDAGSGMLDVQVSWVVYVQN
jgi:hypothetical protein